MNKLRAQHIALVSNTSWSIYNFRLGLVKALIAKGHHVFAIAPADDYSDKLTAVGVTFIPLKMKAYTTSPLEGFMTFIRLLEIYRQYRFDKVLHYTIKVNIYGSIAARFSGLVSIAVVTGLGRTFQFDGLSQILIEIAYKLGAFCSCEFWFLNSEDRDTFISKGLIKREKSFILPSEGVNTNRFVGSPPSSIQKKVVRFLFAGRLLRDKGILEFVEAAKIIAQDSSRIRFEVVGFVNPNNHMSVTLDELEYWQRNRWINYLGSHEDIRPFINRADCVIFPTYYQEGISRILLEAASMSRPIITTDQVGCRDVVQDGYNGLLIPPKSVSSLISAIKEFLALPASAKVAMGLNGRKKVKAQYDERNVIRIYFEKLFSPPNARKDQVNSKSKTLVVKNNF